MSKKIKPNRYKAMVMEKEGLKSDPGTGIDFCLKCIMAIAFITILSLASIFIYDFMTQSAFFNIKNIKISGTRRVPREDILKTAGLDINKNIFGLNLFSIKKRIISHPWIQSASVKRNLALDLTISVTEHEPLAIVKIENLADILINIQGQPFKEYNPQKDQVKNLPVISGLDLTLKDNRYLFNGPLFNSIMNFLKTDDIASVKQIKADKNTGIIIETNDIYNRLSDKRHKTILIKLGFNNFKAKLNKAIKISEYIDKNFPERTISAMDLFNIKKVFIKTKLTDALHNNLEKGV